MQPDRIIEQVRANPEQPELLQDLWDSIKGMCYIKCAERVREAGRTSDLEDCMQECFLALPEAIDRHDPGRGTFLHFFTAYFLPRACSRALYGDTTAAAVRDPLNTAGSIDETINGTGIEDDSLRLIDTLVDTSAELPFLTLDEASFWKSVAAYIDTGINDLPRQERDLLTFVYRTGSTTAEAHRQKICGDLCGSRYVQIFRDAQKHLRQWMIHGKGKRDAERIGLREHFGSSYYRGSLRGFRQTHTSIVERTAIQGIEATERRAAWQAAIRV